MRTHTHTHTHMHTYIHAHIATQTHTYTAPRVLKHTNEHTLNMHQYNMVPCSIQVGMTDIHHFYNYTK